MGMGEELLEKAREVIGFVQDAASGGRALHEVEKRLWSWMLELGQHSLGMFFALCGDGDEGESVTLADGRRVKRLGALHRREYQSVFGAFELHRVVYGTREGQKIEHVPLDGRLKLPAGKFSYLLQDWDQSLSQEMPFAQASETLKRMLGFKQSVHSLERTGRQLAEAVPTFWEDLAVPPAEEEGELMVITADGKGVPMRRGAQSSEGELAEPKSGPKPGDKKMALLGAVYTVDAFPRTPQQVLEALNHAPGERAEPPPKRPEPQFKRVRASLRRDGKDTTEPQIADIFGWMRQEVSSRDPAGEKPLLLVMDGQDSLWNAALVYLPEGDFDVVEILDLLHAIGYVWDAAHLFHPKNSPQASALVQGHVKRLLEGDVNNVIDDLREAGTEHGLRGERLDTLERICGYFTNNAHRMVYHEYLAKGYPIASGIIEGACRCVVNDRMERSGMRWVFPGAHAMLGLRSITLSGLWDELMTFRIAEESRRLYPNAAANDDAMNLSAVA
jgi:hypothetical protein